MADALKRLFWERDEADMGALAASDDVGPFIPEPFRSGVEENLRVLLGHARIVAAALPPGSLEAPPEAFAP